VKTLFRSWTRDGSAFGVVSGDPAWFVVLPVLCPWRLQPVSIIPSRGKLEGFCQAHVEAIVVSVAARGCHMVACWLLAADHVGWRCLATVSAALDCVGGWRLRQRHRGTTRLAADRSGLHSLARATRCGAVSEDGASDFLGLLLWRRWLVQG
jgi:hypothetical protein